MGTTCRRLRYRSSHRRLAPSSYAGPFGLGDPFRLLLATHIIERREDGQNVEEGAASRRRSIQSGRGEVPLPSSQVRSDPRLTFATSSRSSSLRSSRSLGNTWLQIVID